MKSTGPRTPEGKQATSMNGFKHGLTGQRMILQEHEADAYHRLGIALHAQFRPANEIETQLVQHIVDCNMRLNRSVAIDSNLLNVGLVGWSDDDARNKDTDALVAQTRSWVEQADSFEKLGRYEGRISRQLLQYIRELERIQNFRKSELAVPGTAPETSPETNESTEVNPELALFRKQPSPDSLPRIMTAVQPKAA